MRLIISILSLLFLSNFIIGQEYYQYFDGEDTSAANSVLFEYPEDSTNIWQVGPPQKTIFDTAYSQPNVLVTDTVNSYPANDTSRFKFTIPQDLITPWGIIAIRWTQMLDMDSARDGGIMEYSLDTSETWNNVIDDPNVYSLYGHNQANEVTLPSGEIGFSGTDTLWQEIWLCFDASWLSTQDTISFRFSFISDSFDNNKEGWMIDNFMIRETFIHTVSKNEQEEYVKVYPNPVEDKLHLQTKKLNEFHLIEDLKLINSKGRVVQHRTDIPTKYFLDVSGQPPGVYYLQVKTNKKKATVKVVIQK